MPRPCSLPGRPWCPRRSRCAPRSWRWRPSIPPEVSIEEEVAGELLEAVGLLGQGLAAEAAARLERVDRALAGASELDDVRARVLSLRAQCCLELDQATEARVHSQGALRLARSLGDDTGLAEIRELDARIAAELDRERRAELARSRAEGLASTPMAEILARTADPLARADALIRHAGALRTVGDRAASAVSASLAIEEADRAGAVRERVLARLALVDADPSAAREPVLQALAIADAADETTLIGLVAQAARLAGVDLPGHRGPLEPSGEG